MSEESYVMIFGEVFSYTQIIKNEKIIERLKKRIEDIKGMIVVIENVMDILLMLKRN